MGTLVESRTTLAVSSSISSEKKRTKARTQLLGKVNDRSIKGPIAWNRSLSEVHIANYRSECRKLGNPSLFTRQNHLPSPLARRLENNVADSFATFNYHLSGEEPKQTPLAMVKELGYGYEREMSISDIYKLINQPDDKRPPTHRGCLYKNQRWKDKLQASEHGVSATTDTGGLQYQAYHSTQPPQPPRHSQASPRRTKVSLPRISLNIQRTQNSDTDSPEVRLLLKRLPPSHEDLKPTTPYSQIKSNTFGPDEFKSKQLDPAPPEAPLDGPTRRYSFVATSDRGKVNAPPAMSFFQIQNMDTSKYASERTRQWIDINPLGPESPPYDAKEIDSLIAANAKEKQETQRRGTVNINSTIMSVRSQTKSSKDRPQTQGVNVLASKYDRVHQGTGVSFIASRHDARNRPETFAALRYGSRGYPPESDLQASRNLTTQQTIEKKVRFGFSDDYLTSDDD